VIAVREREARITGSYGRLVPLLIEQKRYDKAERWAAEGIRKTAKDAPGIADQLAKAMAELARSRKQWKVAAAHAAWEFFDRPGCEKFSDLVAAAHKIALRPALLFARTGLCHFPITCCLCCVTETSARATTY
jgi:uncharacterized Zn finger protein